MTPEWSVVVLGKGDYDAIVALWQASGLPTRLNGRDSRDQFERQMDQGTQTVLGVRSDGGLIGVVVATQDGRKGWINRLAVHPDFRRQGAAQQLLRAAEEALEQQGMQVIAALIEDWNTASLALFERANYVVHDDIHYVTKRSSHDA